MDLTQLIPKVLVSGGVDASHTVTFSNPVQVGTVFLICGIDAYPAVQPNNGDFSVGEILGGSGGSYVIYQVQQSANFPGPFSWRGIFPILSSVADVQVTATVAFNFNIWGLLVPDFTQDSTL